MLQRQNPGALLQALRSDAAHLADSLDGRCREALGLTSAQQYREYAIREHLFLEPLGHVFGGTEDAAAQCAEVLAFLLLQASITWGSERSQCRSESMEAKDRLKLTGQLTVPPQSSTRSEVSPSPYAANRAGQ